MIFTRKTLIVVFLSTLSYPVLAQKFGSSYDFLIKETNARVAALGAVTPGLRDDDPQLVWSNPALLYGKMARVVGLTVNPGLGKTQQYNLAYADSLNKVGNVFGGLQYLNYGNLTETDESGFQLGQFSASQYAVSLGTAMKKGNYHLGVTMKWIGFQVYGDNAYAAALDLGMFYQHPRKNLSYGLTVRNLGATVRKFQATEQAMPVPFNIQAGLSYKLEHMPLRISAGASYIQVTDIQYVDPSAPGKLDPNGVVVKEKKKISEQIARHLSLGGEFLLHRSFNLRVGYNHLRRKEIRTEAGAGLTGFSLGCMINTRPLAVHYTYSGWQSGGGQHFISLVCRLNQFISARSSN